MSATTSITEIPTAWIPLPDGTRLAARIWLPEGAEARPAPAVLEFLPYRRRDVNELISTALQNTLKLAVVSAFLGVGMGVVARIEQVLPV